jgi:NAD(P)-dependent dehydrogenase (short-subunit alcohol dehydrogenase family)
MGLLDGKVAIITGAGGGIGREHALLFAREGASVLVNDLGCDGRGVGSDPGPAEAVVAEIEAARGAAAANNGDVTNWADAEALVAQAVDTFGRLDILVNNAGILRDRMAFNMSEDEWNPVVDTVLKGTYAPSRFASAYWRAEFKKTGSPVDASIISTSSESGLYSNAGQANYAAAKAGVAALSTVLARDLGSFGVRSNAIAPVANTRLWGALSTTYEVPPAGEFDPMWPGQIAPFVTWLASDLGKGISGQVFGVSGNRIQLIRGYHPVTQIDSEDKDWTSDRIEELHDQLIGGYDVGVPPFLPPLGWQ